MLVLLFKNDSVDKMLKYTFLTLDPLGELPVVLHIFILIFEGQVQYLLLVGSQPCMNPCASKLLKYLLQSNL